MVAMRDGEWRMILQLLCKQLQIRIEMAFGLMVRKWCILQHPSHIPLKHIKYMLIVIAKLHKFCINEWIQTTSNFRSLKEEQELFGGDNERIFAASLFEYESNAEIWSGNLINRENMKTRIIALKLTHAGTKKKYF
jgi:hypothetical protein